MDYGKILFMLEILTFPVLPTKDSYFLKGVALFLLALRVSECGMWHLPYDGYIVLDQKKKMNLPASIYKPIGDTFATLMTLIQRRCAAFIVCVGFKALG